MACVVAEVQRLSAESGDFQVVAERGRFGPRGTEPQTQACVQSELMVSSLSASVIVCVSSPSPSELCKAIRFDLQDSSLERPRQRRTYEVLHSLFFSLAGRRWLSKFTQQSVDNLMQLKF